MREIVELIRELDVPDTAGTRGSAVRLEELHLYRELVAGELDRFGSTPTPGG